MGDYKNKIDGAVLICGTPNGRKIQMYASSDSVVENNVPRVAYIFPKAGVYKCTVEFLQGEQKINSEEFELVLSDDVYHVKKEIIKFDGNKDVVFHFTNGTGEYKLTEITKLSFFVAKQSPFNIELGEGEFSYDMDAGTVTIHKETLKSFLAEADLNAFPNKSIAIKGYAKTDAGETVEPFNWIESKYEFNLNDVGWEIDITDFDPSADEPTVPTKPTIEFAGASSEDVVVSQETGSRIAQNALSYIQNNYEKELSGLGEYSVVSMLECNPITEMNDDVKESFAKALDGATVGQYYDINVKAAVHKNGQAVNGLENINIPQLDKEITIGIKLPENLKKAGRTYTILHYKDGKVESLATTIVKNEISFKTDSFSPYALIYKDTVSANGNNTGNEKPNVQQSNGGIPKTGDYTNLWVLVLSLGFSAVVIGLAAYRKARLHK